MCAGKHASLGIYVQGNNKLGDTLIPATPVPNRKSTLGANFYQPLVVEICQNTCTSREKRYNFCTTIPFLTKLIHKVHW